MVIVEEVSAGLMWWESGCVRELQALAEPLGVQEEEVNCRFSGQYDPRDMVVLGGLTLLAVRPLPVA